MQRIEMTAFQKVACDFLQGIRGNTGDYGNIGEAGPKVISVFIYSTLSYTSV